MNEEFFSRNAGVVARELLGKIVVRKLYNKELKTRIVETEAYFEFRNYLIKIKKFCPDPGDEEYFALYLSKNIPIWSNDKNLKKQNIIEVTSTKKLSDKLDKLIK